MNRTQGPNVVAITRSETDEVFIAGGDEHLDFLVGILGFARVPAEGVRQYQLADGHDELEKVCLATEAARLLTHSGYQVALDESLGVQADVRYVARTGGRMPTDAKTDLEREIYSVEFHLGRAPDLAEAARILDVLVGEDGVIDRTATALRAQGPWAEGAADGLRDKLAFAAETMSDLRRMLAEAVSQSTPKPDVRADAARTKPSRALNAPPSPTGPPAAGPHRDGPDRGPSR
ncbi:hypothetical protein [Kitasatospora sp. NRRL B-11411]|uniref:hypothetical protein n=1 Tax=Kitasatospora sp. NRRL B-11411 TaxID=1463822 RepID=UPI0004C3FE68|nr:hypothetical protein [Kitasatospora sp. NRRL B-11411]